MKNMKKALSVLFIFLMCKTFAQKVIKNINETPYGSSIDSKFKMVELNGIAYYNATDGVHGVELWRTDGTEAGTWLVKDIDIESASNYHGSLSFDGVNQEWTPTVLNNKIIFPAFKSAIGDTELWVSDGTSEGTVLLKDINTNMNPTFDTPTTSYPGGGNNNEFVTYNGQLYFPATEFVNGGFNTGIWKTDGTPEGTVLVANFPNSGFQRTTSVTIINDNLYCVANETDFWKLNLQNLQVKKLKTFNKLTRGYKKELVVFNNKIYFSAVDSNFGHEIFSYTPPKPSDANDDGILDVLDVTIGTKSTYPANLTVMNGSLYFIGYDEVNQQALWKSDGTTQGTNMLIDINTTDEYPHFSNGITMSPGESFFVFQNKFWFAASNGINGVELWMSDGTAEGTKMIADNMAGTNNGNPSNFIAYNSKIFYSSWYYKEGMDGSIQNQLLSYDPLTNENMLYWQEGMNRNARGNDMPVIYNANLYFSGSYDISSKTGYELCTLDNTLSVAETTLAKSTIKIYPNPGISFIQCIDSENVYPLELKITNLLGQVCKTGLINQPTENLSIDELQSGMYIIQITDKEKNTSIQKWLKK